MISMIWAQDRNGLIGIDGHLPWYRPADLKNFSRLTRGNTVIMGRKTFESIGNVLPNRNNIILSNQKYSYTKEGKYFTSFCSFETIIYSIPRCDNLNDIFVIGGMQTYKSFAKFTDRMYITIINDIFPLNGKEATFFPWPAFNGVNWNCIEQSRLGPDFYYIFNKKADDYARQKESNTYR